MKFYQKIDNVVLMILSLVFLIVALGFLITNRKSLFNEDFSTSVEGLPEAKSPETIMLKDGDTFDLKATIVKKKINGNFVKMLAYNGSIPGPILKIPQGSEVTINFKNETDVPSTLHAHGVRMDNAYDGLPDTSQVEVPPGGSFTYKIRFKDVGIFWYHPHVREDYAQELGLYGNFLVTPKDLNYWSPVNEEVPIFVDDIAMEDPKVTPFHKKVIDHTLMGRFGNIFLTNGYEDYRLSVKRGEVVRFYFTNSANTRTFNLAIKGVKMKLVGGDNGAYEKDKWVDTVVVGPSERVIVEALFLKSGVYQLENETPDEIDKLGNIVVGEDSVTDSFAGDFDTLKTHEDTIKSIEPFRAYLNKQPDKFLKLFLGPDNEMKMDMSSMQKMSVGGIEWSDQDKAMNEKSNMTNTFWKIQDQATGKENMAIDWQFKVGDKVMIRITNEASMMHSMQHPIHFHGQRFLVADVSGVKQDDLVWKDTVLVPSGGYVDILLDASNPGVWMAHCHIAEHLEAGMMFDFKVN